jgi:uncharacterized protein YprB with RNaseH-like and TPR domain
MRLARRLARMSRETSSAKPPRTPEYSHYPSPKSGTSMFEEGEVWSSEFGECWITTPNIWEFAFNHHITTTLSGPPAPALHLWPDQWRRPHITVLDIETCGFTALPIFMIGLLRISETSITLRQGIARDYGEEAALLHWAHEMLNETGAVVTFNGKSFDMRYIRERSAYSRLPAFVEPPHVDLLHISRRLWGENLPNCRLQTLESSLCGRLRVNDIPGIAIPDVYHHFVRTGNTKDLATVAKHNILDIITLAELFSAAWHETAKRNKDEQS